MPIIRSYRHGLTAGIPPSVNSHPRALRGDVGGWSDKSTRSNTRFLYSVDERELDGRGMALTLTLRDCPPTHDEWHRMRRAMIKRLERMGLVRGHWLTEWQRRGVPHLHAAVWFENRDPFLTRSVRDAWLSVAGAYGASPQAQHVVGISDAVGWFQYLSKHAVRGLGHYQRSSENMPDGWKTTGRMWGHVGDWPVNESLRIEIDLPGFYAFRRIVQRWRLADSKAEGDANRIRSAKRMLRSKERAVGQMRGVSEWLPERLTLPILTHLAAMGFSVRN